MGAYNYTALDASGKNRKGVVQADNEKTARQQLRQQGLTPIDLRYVSEASQTKVGYFNLRRTRVSVAELALLTRQLATMLQAGIPLDETLQSIAEQAEKQRGKSMLLAVRAKVLEGHSLATGLAEFPHVFNNLYRATVAAGEKTGHLDKVLERLAEFTERRQEVRQKIIQALIYPSVIICAAIGIVSFLLAFVVPKMITVFQQSGQALPVATQILLALSQFLQSFGLYLVIVIIAAVVLFIRALRRPLFKARMDRWLLKLPLFGKAIRLVNTARFAHTFAILTSAGVSVLEAMRIGSDIVTNTPIKESLLIATRQVREGVAIHRALKQTGYFPPMSIYLIASGENTGRLEPMLQRSAHTQEQQVERMINVILALFEPLMILVMGSIVLFIVLAILLPIFNMDQLVH
ncbi:MAG: type II secretion system protein GspF [Gammaproteobacteria bacterium]|nr:type II secretion system protein GspF [Gammaproteobacteria bacterium]